MILVPKDSEENIKKGNGCGRLLIIGCLSMIAIPFVLLAGLSIVVAILEGSGVYKLEQPTTVVDPSPVSSPEKVIGQHLTKDGYYAARTEEDMNKMIQVLVQKDEAAFQQMLGAGLIFPIPPNQKVFLTGCHGMICSTITFRYEGQPEEYWTYEEAISKD